MGTAAEAAYFVESTTVVPEGAPQRCYSPINFLSVILNQNEKHPCEAEDLTNSRGKSLVTEEH